MRLRVCITEIVVTRPKSLRTDAEDGRNFLHLVRGKIVFLYKYFHAKCRYAFLRNNQFTFIIKDILTPELECTLKHEQVLRTKY